MEKILFPLFLATALLTAFTGCETGAYPPKNTNKFDGENNVNFVLLDAPTQRSVTCTGLQQRVLEDGRLEITANVRNREAHRVQVQVSCVFKDEQGFPTGDETPFTSLILSENAQEGVKFVSLNPLAKKYTIRVRQAH